MQMVNVFSHNWSKVVSSRLLLFMELGTLDPSSQFQVTGPEHKMFVKVTVNPYKWLPLLVKLLWWGNENWDAALFTENL